jgi:hypothetical protein
LAALVLERTVERWDDARVTVSVAALEAWFVLAARLLEPPPAPRLGSRWIELVPTEPIDVESRGELVRFDEWLALVGVLRAFAPDDLDRFGFPEQQHGVFAAFVEDVASRPSHEADELVERILRRIRRFAPAYALAADHARQALAAQDEPWFEVRFETHPRRPEPALSDRTLVDRVLRDLG